MRGTTLPGGRRDSGSQEEARSPLLQSGTAGRRDGVAAPAPPRRRARRTLGRRPASRGAIPAEVLQKVRRLEIQMKHLVNDIFSGEYHSVFKGRGMEFAEVREYTPGDDIRAIDWNVTARLGAPYVKKFAEERELTVMLAVDLSASGTFGSGLQLKRDLAAEVGAILAFSAVRNNDKVGCVLFTDDVELFVPPLKGRQHTLRLVRELLYFQPEGRGTNLGAALEFLAQVLKRKAVVFLISDFLDPGFETPLSVVSRRHDVVPITITDAREEKLPAVDLVELVDAETGQRLVVDAGSAEVRARFERRSRMVRAWRERIFRRHALDAIDLRTDAPYVLPLMAYFRKRARRY